MLHLLYDANVDNIRSFQSEKIQSSSGYMENIYMSIAPWKFPKGAKIFSQTPICRL